MIDPLPTSAPQAPPPERRGSALPWIVSIALASVLGAVLFIG
jgi:hypothetical protein